MKNLTNNLNLRQLITNIKQINNMKMIIRTNTTITHGKDNSLHLTGYKIPRLNIGRNQARLTQAMNALRLYISNQLTGMDQFMIQSLVDLMSHLETLYHRDPKKFVSQSKMLGNWFKVNVFAIKRDIGAVPILEWNSQLECPRILQKVFNVITSDRHNKFMFMFIRLISSILDVYGVVLVPKEPDMSTVTEKFTGNDQMIDNIDVDRALERLGVNTSTTQELFQLLTEKRIWHSTSAQGPNGQALWTSHIDAKAVWFDDEVRENLKKYLELVGREGMMQNLEDTVKLPQFWKLTDGVPQHSKLHVIFEKGDKARVIAVGDYWTQEALVPMHDLVATVLKDIKMDGTFDQDKIANQVKIWSAESGISLHSLDLSAATDRLPVALQARIIDALLISETIGDAWLDLVTKRDFTVQGLPNVRYSVGQPMGFKSSFMMLGLTHHVIVQEAAARSGFDKFENYVILGDDIVIADTTVANQYEHIMKQLGLTISLHKTIHSDSKLTSQPIAEICKRTFSKGTEFSSIPVRLLVTAIENGDLLYQLQEELFRRDLVVDRENLHYFFGGLVNQQSYTELAKLNGLPPFMTGMKNPILTHLLSSFDSKTWAKSKGISLFTLEQFFTYTVLVEQLKRLGEILRSTENIYTTLIKAANVTKSVGFSGPLQQYLPHEEFSQETLNEWEVIKPFHPAIEVVTEEVERVNTLLSKISMASGTDMMKLLLANVVDSLKISSFEFTPDKIFAEAKITRKLVDDTLRNIQRSMINGSLNKTTQLTFSIKLQRISAIWNIKVDLDTPIVINRNVTQISTSNSQAVAKVQGFLSKGVFSDLSLKDVDRRNSKK